MWVQDSSLCTIPCMCAGGCGQKQNQDLNLSAPSLFHGLAPHWLWCCLPCP